ncbi:MAG: flagellar FliJ family protein [Micavibrio sp.]|nr:flagellar FliJ family protein [Micavibrio sp.]
MADLTSLIRVRKHTVEQKQKIVADLYKKADDLKAERESILSNLETEREKANEMGVEMLSYMGNYTKAVDKRIKSIEIEEKKLEARIEVAREDMRHAFSEFKKIEITQERREAEERKEMDKKQSDQLDEIALEIFRRKTEEEHEGN